MTRPAQPVEPAGPTEEELAAVLAALRVKATAAPGAAQDSSPLATWRRRRLAVLGHAPRFIGGEADRRSE